MVVRMSAATGAALASAAVLLVATLRAPQQLYSDPAWQLKAAQQYVAHGSPTPNTVVSPDERDLSRDQQSWLSWWAPGTNFLALPLISSGLTIAASVRIVAAGALVFGAVGWALWIDRLRLRAWQGTALAAAVPWLHHASNGLFQYSAESLVFGVLPWALLAAAASAAAPSLPRACLAGGICGLAYVLKYSTALVTLGVIPWVLWRFWNDHRVSRARVYAAGVALLSTMLIPVTALSIANSRFSGAANLLTAETAAVPTRPFAALAVGAPVLKAADLDSLLRYVLVNPNRPIVTHAEWLLVAGIPAAVALVWLCVREPLRDQPKQLALAIYGSSVLGLGAIWATSGAVSLESRHVTTAGLAVLPLGIRAGTAAWSALRRPLIRVALAALFGCYIAGPALYGVAAASTKIVRTPQAYRAGPSGVLNPLFAAHDAAGCRTDLLRDFRDADDIWYLTEPMSGLDLPGRALMVHADFLTLDALATHTYRSSKPVRVFALLPREFESNGKGQTIRSSFHAATSWTRSEFPACNYVLWVSKE